VSAVAGPLNFLFLLAKSYPGHPGLETRYPFFKSSSLLLGAP
jgi:hypothetical protein